MDTIISLFGVLFVCSLIAIMIQFRRFGKYTWGEMRHNPLWPMLILEYRDYTREKYGTTGKLYYIAIISSLGLIALCLIQGAVWLIRLIVR